jgi:hypothetical protein
MDAGPLKRPAARQVAGKGVGIVARTDPAGEGVLLRARAPSESRFLFQAERTQRR